MECKSASEGASCGGDGGISVCEDGGAGWLTSTPHPPRRPLQHLNTASPRPPLTPYRYHGCKAIPEEREDQENIDPASKVIQESCVNVKSSGMSPENTNTTHTGSGSSPFAYPLIWEASHSTTSSSPSEKKPIADLTTWRSPVSHYRATESQAKEEVKEEEGKEGKEGGGKVRNRSGSSSEVSLSKVACHGPSVTPSKAPHTQTLSNASSLFLTPSSSMHSSRPWESRGGQTPKQQRVAFSASGHVNPFEVGAESLYLSAVSPSLFRQVVSPSQKTDMNFRWSIDQMAMLEPVNIETSPFMQVETFVDPEYERRAQDAIDRFFTQSVIPSPWTGNNKSVSVVKKMCVQQSQASPSLPLPRTQSVWCQTELTLPPVLPAALEEALKPFCTFTQNQGWQGSSEGDEAGCLNNTTLRRKLLFGHDDLASNTPSSQGGSEPSSPSPPRSLHDLRSPTHAAEGHKITEEEEEVEDVGLVWCTSPLAPGSVSEEIGGGSKMRQSPHTSPSAHGPALSSTTQAALRPHTEDKLLSPDISPIHHHQYSDTEAKQAVSCVSLEGSYLELPHATYTFTFANEVSAVSSGPHLSASLVSGAGESSGTGNQWRRSKGEQHTFSPTHSSTQHHQHHHQPCMEAMGSEVLMGTEEEVAKEEEDERQKIVSMKDSFSSQDDDQDMKCRSPVTSSPTAQLRASSNSGHFSSSPRQDLSHSPLEVDSPARKFSVSPPLSPIFCRPLLFPTQPSCRPQSVNVKEVKGGLEVTLMEESEVCGVPAAAITTLPRCSTLCDVEMDSQPLVEQSHLGEEMASQDTGYQTASTTSLLTSNYSTTTFPQDPAPLAPMSDTTKHSLPTSKEYRPSIV